MNPFMDSVLVEFYVMNAFCCKFFAQLTHNMMSLYTFVAESESGSGCLTWEKLLVRLQIPAESLKPSFVVYISALQELKEVCSWCMAFQAIGPPRWKMTAPLMLRKLNNGRRVPAQRVIFLLAQIALSICEPQNLSLYMVKCSQRLGAG